MKRFDELKKANEELTNLYNEVKERAPTEYCLRRFNELLQKSKKDLEFNCLMCMMDEEPDTTHSLLCGHFPFCGDCKKELIKYNKPCPYCNEPLRWV